MALNYASLIRDIERGGHGDRGLEADDAQALFAAMLADLVPPVELDAALGALAINGTAPAQTIGFLRALDAHADRLGAPPDRPRPIVLPSYGGTRRQPNLTALVALLLQRFGVPALVHGLSGANAAMAGPDAIFQEQAGRVARQVESDAAFVTTAAVLWELGIEPAVNLADVQARLAHDNIAYVPADVFAPGLARLLRHRARPGARSPLRLLAKLIDPFGGDGYRVVSVSAPADLAIMRELLAATCADALLLPDTEGEPFANPAEPPQIERFVAGVGSICVEAERVGAAAMPMLPASADAPTTAAWITQALAGTQPVPAPIVAQLACCLEGARR
jgi:anthranilate phosphoribosyltransferase